MGAGVAERVFHNMPRDIVFDPTPHVMNKNKEDPMFWCVRDMFIEWLRYIDDCFAPFQGDGEKADWFVNKLNSLFPGQLQFTFDFEEVSLVFLDLKISLNRQTNKLEVDKYVKPTNSQLYLNFKSCHAPHIFPSIVYSQALTAFKICSRDEWRSIHFENLREKFLEQNYPEEMISVQFEKVLKLNRSDLIFKRNKKTKDANKTSRFSTPLIITYHPQNPPIYKWIKEEMGILHLNKQCRDIIPAIPVVTRQAKNVGQISVRARHWLKDNQQDAEPGCKVVHADRCVACKRMKETDTFRNEITGKTYRIKRKYSCKSSWIIYLAECSACNTNYIGQTFDQRGFVGRHYGHRQDCKAGVGGLGQHFHQHHAGSMEELVITIIDSVEPGNHSLLDRKEEEWIHRLKTMDHMGMGGMNVRDDIKRNTNIKCKCKFCK